MSIVLIKMSGAAIADVDGDSFLDVERLDSFASQVAGALTEDDSLRVAIVVGGGNILRGKSLDGVQRVKADYMGMLATVINSLALQDSLARFGADSRILTGIEVPKVAEPYIQGRAIKHLSKGRVVIFGGGTGNPFFTTDTAAALRASEIAASVVLLAKDGTDGVYDQDPRKFAGAKKYEQITYEDLMVAGLEVMDQQAAAHCRENAIPVYVFNMESDGAVRRALLGEREAGTLVGGAVTVFA